MARIFLVLSVFAALLLVLNIVLGFTGGDVAGTWQHVSKTYRDLDEQESKIGITPEEKAAIDEQRQQLRDEVRPIMKAKHIHFLVGVLAALVTVLVNSISVTYFIGTGRWCKEVVQTYSLDEIYVQNSNDLKRKTFPWAVLSILIILVIVSMGAMSDPSANRASHAAWVMPHFMAAIAGTAVIVFSFLKQAGNVGANYQIINQILEQVKAEREKRGLES